MPVATGDWKELAEERRALDDLYRRDLGPLVVTQKRPSDGAETSFRRRENVLSMAYKCSFDNAEMFSRRRGNILSAM